MIQSNKSLASKIGTFAIDNIVTLVFFFIVIFGVAVSGFTPSFIINEVVTRFFRNALLVLSLVIPIIAGLGLNFGIVIGALAGMHAIFLIRYHEIPGMWGLFLCFLVATPIALFYGYLTGKLYNKTRGQEMIASLIVAFFAQGIHLIIGLFVIGGIIPVRDNHFMIIPMEQWRIEAGHRPMGLRANFDMGLPLEEIRFVEEGDVSGMARALDGLWRMDFLFAVIILAGALLAALILRRVLAKKRPSMVMSPKWVFWLKFGILAAVIVFAVFNLIFPLREIARLRPVPVVTALVIAAFCLFITYFTKTKLGQDCRSIGQSQPIANAAGINVDRTRLIATMLSTLFAAWGMIIMLQSMGTVPTYDAHRQIGFFSVAAILVGGATVAKAGVSNVILGLVLFHTMTVISPAIGRFFGDDVAVGEYTRTFMVYGVIGASLGLYAWKTLRASREKERLDRKEASLIDRLKAEKLTKANPQQE